MIEVSVTLFTLLVEGLVLALLALGVWTVLALRSRKRDRDAIKQLIKQIKHQSQTRLETTGSFLSEKYHFAGDELKKSVKSIDRAEKKFMQGLMQTYLKRDAEAMTAMDASVAELIDTYKSLTPVIPNTDTLAAENEALQQQLAESQQATDSLQEELSITKETMSNMISEFGNMFGGGSTHELAKHEVVEELQKRSVELHEDADEEALSAVLLDEDTKEMLAVSDEDAAVMSQPESNDPTSAPADGQTSGESVGERVPPADEATNQDEVDELLDSIDLSRAR